MILIKLPKNFIGIMNLQQLVEFYMIFIIIHGKRPFLKKHGFVHAEEARVNAWKYFPENMNYKVEDIIRRHMFPLNKRPPKYKESWLISFVDKADSMDFIMHPKALLKIFFHKEIQEEKNMNKKNFIKKLKQKLHRK